MLTGKHHWREAGCGLLAALLLAVPATAAEGTDTVAEATPRPTVALEKCTDRYAIACQAPFCLRVRTTGWDTLPSDLTETPEVFVQFSRDIRDRNGQRLPANRTAVTLDPGRDHDRTLWFQTDDGPLFLAFVDFTAALATTAADDAPFDRAPAQSRVVYRMAGDACWVPTSGWWFGGGW